MANARQALMGLHPGKAPPSDSQSSGDTSIRVGTDGSKRPLARNRILSARFMDSEYAALENFAWSKGMTLADWVRGVLLHSLEGPGEAQMEMHIFTELVGIQMLLMNTLEPLLRGDKFAPEQLTILFRQVQTTKAAKAHELLAKRSQNREK
jgi:hypothetical protein